MISKYNGTCFYCKQPTKANVDEYELESKKSFHLACKEQDEAKPAPEQFALAERLHFIAYWPAMGVDGFLRAVSQTRGGLAAWGLDSTAHRGQEFALRSGDEVENISENRGTQKW
jgi:hypothetical protein